MALDHKVVLERIGGHLESVLSDSNVHDKNLKTDASLLLQGVSQLLAAVEQMRTAQFKSTDSALTAPVEFISLCEENYELYTDFTKQYSLVSLLEV